MSIVNSNNPKMTAMLYGEIPALVEQAKKVIELTLSATDGNVSAAAKRLKVGRATMYRWMHDFPDIKFYLDRLPRER
jgi:transcriptional regulator of acetoin/glycerol metabolism